VDENPKKLPEKSGRWEVKKANILRKCGNFRKSNIVYKLLINIALFHLGFILDTPPPRTYYAARKF
jgi:hypothetical protein